MKKDKIKFDFTAFGQAIKAARKAKGFSKNRLVDELNISRRYITGTENSGQHPSLQIFYALVTLLDISTLPCLSRSLTTIGLTPALINSVAYVWRSIWKWKSISN